jgi:hypothetical protein
VKANRTGTYTGAITNSALNRCYTFEYTISVANTWEYKTVTIPGDTTGTWTTDNTAGCFIDWAMAVGPSVQAAAGSWQALGAQGTANQVNAVAAVTDTFQITGVSCVAGSTPVDATMSPYIVPRFAEALQQCLRYYEKSFNYTVAPAQNAGGGDTIFPAQAGAVSFAALIQFKVKKRAAPTLLTYNPAAANAEVRDTSLNVDCSGTSIGSASENTCRLSWIGNSTTVLGDLLKINWTADARL